jgi:hypothetical protein
MMKTSSRMLITTVWRAEFTPTIWLKGHARSVEVAQTTLEDGGSYAITVRWADEKIETQHLLTQAECLVLGLAVLSEMPTDLGTITAIDQLRDAARAAWKKEGRAYPMLELLSWLRAAIAAAAMERPD